MTDDSYDDDRLDERLRKLAAEHYNAPRGAVPRDAMWSAIAAARQAERAESQRATVIPIASRQRGTRWRWAAAIAAALLAGVLIDRIVVARNSDGARLIAARPAKPQTSPERVPASSPAPQEVAIATPSPTTAEPRASEARATRDGDRTPRSTTRVAQAPRPTQRATTSGPATDAPAGDPRGLYQAAARQTLVQAEALLTTYRRADALPRDAEAMQQAARWSRDVLSSTRLLLDSPAGRDPRLRQLLTDLELVLAQIVQVSGAPLQADEREMIERALRDRDLLPRLRSAVPAGVSAS